MVILTPANDQGELIPSTDEWPAAMTTAWQSHQLRTAFEAETGMAPLGGTDLDQLIHDIIGDVDAYCMRFLIWATKRLGLVSEAPSTIQNVTLARW